MNIQVKNKIENSDDLVIYSPRDIENIFNMSKNTAYALMHMNGFPSITIGRNLYVYKGDLIKWLEKNKRKELRF